MGQPQDEFVKACEFAFETLAWLCYAAQSSPAAAG